MSKIAMLFKKNLILLAITAMGLSTIPFVTAYAQSPTPPATPTQGQTLTDRLQKAWAREQTIYTRIGNILNRASSLISKIQTRLDDAKTKGKDVSSVQTALDAFSTAVQNVQPIYTSMGTIIQSHSGFDASGNVTDTIQALETVQSLRVKFVEIRQVGLREAGKALREAIQAFRQANQSATPTPTSTSS
jgi:chaperonin cofactor prefoldin